MSKFLKWATASAAISMLALSPWAGSAMANTNTRALEESKPRSGVKIDVDWVTRTARSGLAKVEQKQYANAMADFVSIRDSEVFNTLPETQKFAVYFEIGLCQQSLGQYKESYATLSMAATVSPGISAKDRSVDYWFMLMDAANSARKPEVVIEAMTIVATDFPEAVKYLSNDYVSQTLRQVRPLKDSAGPRLKLLEALRKADYQAEPFSSVQFLWYQLMTLYVDKGDMAAAKTTAGLLTEPWIIVCMRIDKRYRPFIDADPARFDLAKAADEAVAKARRETEIYPHGIEGVTELARALMDANRAAEGLAVIDATLKRVESAPKDKPVFDDLATKLDWAYDVRTRLLAVTGDEKAELAAQIKARDTAKANNSDPISHAVNLGDYYYQHDRPKEALEAVADVTPDKGSPYGIMATEEVRACAYAQLGDKDNLAKKLDYMKAHAKDGYAPLRSVLICVGDLDALAAMVIEQLNDPDERNLALLQLQTYLPVNRAKPGPYAVQEKAIQAALKARKDVREAVGKYGYIESYPMYAPGN